LIVLLKSVSFLFGDYEAFSSPQPGSYRSAGTFQEKSLLVLWCGGWVIGVCFSPQLRCCHPLLRNNPPAYPNLVLLISPLRTSEDGPYVILISSSMRESLVRLLESQPLDLGKKLTSIISAFSIHVRCFLFSLGDPLICTSRLPYSNPIFCRTSLSANSVPVLVFGIAEALLKYSPALDAFPLPPCGSVRRRFFGYRMEEIHVFSVDPPF